MCLYVSITLLLENAQLCVTKHRWVNCASVRINSNSTYLYDIVPRGKKLLELIIPTYEKTFGMSVVRK